MSNHGYFEQSAGQHLVYGCDKCARMQLILKDLKILLQYFTPLSTKDYIKLELQLNQQQVKILQRFK